jgi:hypothetical protein
MYRRSRTRAATILLAATLISLQAGSGFLACAEDAPVSSTLLSQLRQLKPLPKVHYSWPLPFEKLSDELLYEYVRLTHAASLSGEWCKPKQIERCVSICKKVNATGPKIEASIAVNYSPWHRHFGKDLPPTDTGPTCTKELDSLKTRMQLIHDQLKTSNEEHARASRSQQSCSTVNASIRAPTIPNGTGRSRGNTTQFTISSNAYSRKPVLSGMPAAPFSRVRRPRDGARQGISR